MPPGASRCPRCAGRSHPAPQRRSFPWTPVVIVALLAGAGVAYFALGSGSSAKEAEEKRSPNAALPARTRDPNAVLREDRDTFANLEPGETKVLHVEADRDMIAVLEVFASSGVVRAAAMTIKGIVLTPVDDERLKRIYRDARSGAPLMVHSEARAGEIVGCYVQNPGAEAIRTRIRLRWWSLGEPPPPPPPNPNDDTTKTHTIPAGESIEIFLVASKSSDFRIDVTPKGGMVKAAMMPVESMEELTDQEKDRLKLRLTNVPAPHTESFHQATRIGQTIFCVIYNPGNAPVIVEVRNRVGAAARQR